LVTTTLPASNDGGAPGFGRNNTLTSLAGAMRRKGMTEDTINVALQTENLRRFPDPLDTNEVSGIATSIMRYPAAVEVDELLKSLTDTGNAARFGRHHAGRVIYVSGLGWMVWDGLQWQRDDVGMVMEMAKALARGIYSEGEALADDARVAIAKHARSSQQSARLKAMLELAQSVPELVVEPAGLDAHDMLLGVGNGVVNLKNGTLQPANPADRISRHSPVMYDPEAKCPQFLSFIEQVTGGDKDLAKYLQHVVGYSLTGLATEQCLFFLYGNGANGKSTFLNVVTELLGPDLARQTPSETLMARRSSGASNDIARLQNVRVVIANEIEDGSLLAESLVKQMTGGEPMTGRFLYQEYVEFTPKFKLFIAGNHKPTIRGRDNGIWRRIRLIPFTVTIPPEQRDKNLQAKLRAELPGILNWAIAGCRACQKSGLEQPQVVTDAVNNYRLEMDLLGAWIEEKCVVDPKQEWKSRDAYSCYSAWAVGGGYKPMSESVFSRELADKFKREKRRDANHFVGIGRKVRDDIAPEILQKLSVT
jgi:putative DNA primase/helicase